MDVIWEDAIEGFTPRKGAATNDVLEDYVAHMPGVVDRLKRHADKSARKASAKLAQHRETGNARIETHQEALDWYVDLVDPNALTIEVGRAPAIYPDGTTDEGSEGLFIVTNATGADRLERPREARRRAKNRHTLRDKNTGRYRRRANKKRR
jgi:hypothetical protein